MKYYVSLPAECCHDNKPLMSPQTGDSRRAAQPSVSQNPPLSCRGGRGPPFPRCTPPLLRREEKEAEGRDGHFYFPFRYAAKKKEKKKREDALIHVDLHVTALSLLPWQHNGSICRKSQLNKDVPEQRKPTA